MISREGDEGPRGRPLLWATLLSIAIHALLLPFAVWLSSVNPTLVAAKPPQREIIVASTAVRIERRPVPQPRLLSRPPSSQTRSSVRPRVAQRGPPPASQRHELAREQPSAAPEPTAPEIRRPNAPDALQRQLAQQEQAFSQEIAQLRARDNPLSLATKPTEPAATYHRTYFDVPGHRDVDAVQVQLIPIRHWYAGATICYYTRYIAQYTHGGSEDGTIPWPICYPINGDRIAHPPFVHDVPVPIPPPGYVLPPGTYLTPLLARIYANRASDRN